MIQVMLRLPLKRWLEKGMSVALPLNRFHRSMQEYIKNRVLAIVWIHAIFGCGLRYYAF